MNVSPIQDDGNVGFGRNHRRVRVRLCNQLGVLSRFQSGRRDYKRQLDRRTAP
jgi:hypothetical protein